MSSREFALKGSLATISKFLGTIFPNLIPTRTGVLQHFLSGIGVRLGRL